MAAELRLIPAIVTSDLSPAMERLVTAAEAPEFVVALVLVALVTVPLEAVAVKRGVGSRFAALAGIAVGLALYLPAHCSPKDPFGAVMVSVLIAVFVGVGVGFGLGLAARAVTGSRV